MTNPEPQRIRSISEFHRISGLPKPEHPLISVIDFELLKPSDDESLINRLFDFYAIALKRDFNGKIKYGQQEYDFDDGMMTFISPKQTLRIENNRNTPSKHSGWLLLIHPDFLWNNPLAIKIKQYGYFDYSVHEALFLSEKEQVIITDIIEHIQQEYHANIDLYSQSIIISQLDLLLSYAERFYQRQFITRKITNHQVLVRLENLLEDYFNGEEIVNKGLPTVAFVAESLNVSPDYLSGLLRTLTGMNTRQHIHYKLIEKAKEKLSTTSFSISEIAYQLGFEHLQSFSKLFKAKTTISPADFRQSFN